MHLDVGESGTWRLRVGRDVETLEDGVLEEVVYLELNFGVWCGGRGDLWLWDIESCLGSNLRAIIWS